MGRVVPLNIVKPFSTKDSVWFKFSFPGHLTEKQKTHLSSIVGVSSSSALLIPAKIANVSFVFHVFIIKSFLAIWSKELNVFILPYSSNLNIASQMIIVIVIIIIIHYHYKRSMLDRFKWSLSINPNPGLVSQEDIKKYYSLLC